MDMHGYPWTSMGIHGHPLISMVFHRHLRVSMDINRYARISSDTRGRVKSSPKGAPATPRVFPQRALVQSFKTKSSPLSRLVVATCWWPSVLQPGASGTICFLLSGLVFLCRFSILQQRAQPLRDFMCSLSQRAQCFVSDQ